jgi:hypothetical protein
MDLNIPVPPSDNILWLYFLIIAGAYFIASYFTFSLEKRFVEIYTYSEEKNKFYFKAIVHIYNMTIGFVLSSLAVGLFAYFIDGPILNNSYMIHFDGVETSGFFVASGLCLTQIIIAPFYYSWFKGKRSTKGILYNVNKKSTFLIIIYNFFILPIISLFLINWNIPLESWAINVVYHIIILLHIILLMPLLKGPLATIIITIIFLVYSLLPINFIMKAELFFNYEQKSKFIEERDVFFEKYLPDRKN